MLTSTRPNKCKHCRERMPADKARHVLHEDCIAPWLAVQNAKKAAKAKKEATAARRVEKAVDRQRAEKIKKTSKWEDECRKIVQKIARIRDRHDGCISCHLPASWGGQWHGSHFRSHGAASAVQFHLWNIHKSCYSCNFEKSGNLEGYRPRIIEKIGQERVDWLLSQNQIVRHPVDYYKKFKRVMGKRLRRLEKQCSAV